MDKLKKIYAEIDSLSDEIPAELARKIYLYSQALILIGKYHAESVKEYGYRYAERKKVWGEAIVNNDGTAKDKEGWAEIMSYAARKKEAEAEAEMWKWKNAFVATQEIINALKAQLKTLMQEYSDAS